jgi:signal transduction histidine kinase
LRHKGKIMGSLVATSARISSSVTARYVVALCAGILVIVVRWALNAPLGDSIPYVTLYPAVAFAAWCCGVGPSVVLTVASLLASQYLFVDPKYSWSVPDMRQLAGMLAFVVGAAVIIVIGEVVRRDASALQKAQSDLEEKVQQRTVELKSANHNLGELSARLLHLQDEERRRIARELHDSVGQTLAALSMNLAAIGADVERLAKTATTIADSTALVSDMSTDIRTISYLLHPPLLDEAGLSSALTWYIKGFSERSKIEVELRIPEDFGRLSRDLETAVFRVVQECLTNIHRHSGSPVARIVIAHLDDRVRIEVEDKGKGISPQKRAEIMTSATGTPGVGIRGMRERLRQLGGTLEIRSSGEGKGTQVTAYLPAVAPPTPMEARSAAAGAASVQ